VRVVNDNQQRTEAPQVNFSEVLFWGMLSAIGFSSLLLAPLPVIVAHLRLTDPWSKVATLLGALVGLLYFELPLWTVVFEFAFSLLAADLIVREKKLWWVLGLPVASTAATVGGALVLFSAQKGIPVLEFWRQLITAWSLQLKASVPSETPVQWDVITSLLTEQGLFLLVGFLFLSLWLSIGLLAHFNAFPPGHHMQGQELRKQIAPKWMSVGFISCFVLGVLNWPFGPLFLGVFRVFSTVMFIFGTCAVSRVLSRRKLMGPVRSTVYLVSVMLGFYVVVGLGFVSPWTRSFLGEEA